MLRLFRLPAAIVALVVLAFAVVQAAAVAPGNPAFQRTWERTDQPVASGAVARTWIWGPEANTAVLTEPYAEAPGGQRQVQYFDKSRMEINNPSGDPTSPFYVTNGLLVVELMTGRLQLGDNQFQQHAPAQVNVAGDPDDPLTYADLAPLRSAPAVPNGSLITQRIDGNGVVTNDPSLASQGVTAAFRLSVPGIDHQVASPFWTFLNSSGPVRIAGQTTTQRLFDPWFYATGYPITEAYWARVKIGGTLRLVLVQCFERRCLTYTPGNPAGFEVEAGNVGQHYRVWRYEQIPGNGSPTATSTRTATGVSTTATSTATSTSTSTATSTATATYDPPTDYAFVTSWGGAYDPSTQLQAVGSLATDADGNVYLLDYNTNSVEMYDSSGVLLNRWGQLGSGIGQFNTPLGIMVDLEGDIYVADTLNHRIQKFGANGIYERQWLVVDPNTLTQLEPRAITVGPTGLIYVAGFKDTLSYVQVYDGLGGFLTQFSSQGVGAGQIYLPAGLAFDSFNNLYVLSQGASPGANRVVKFTSAGIYVGQWGNIVPSAGDMTLALSVWVDALNTVYVADAGNPRVIMFSTAGDYLGTFAYPRDTGSPVAVTTDDDDNLYIVDSADGVFKYNSERELQFSWSDGRRGLFLGLGGIEETGDGTHLVVDSNGDRILRFTNDGQFLYEWGETGVGPGQFDEPIGVAVNRAGQIYVVDRVNDRIQKFSPDGVYISQWGSTGSGNGQFLNPINIAIDADDNIYVTDHQLNRVQKFTSEGSYLDQWGSAGAGEGEFAGPEGIAVYGNTVYVADTDNNRVQAFTRDGDYLFQWGSTGSANGQFDEPTGIAVDRHGYVYVSEENNHRLQTFTPGGEHIATFGTRGDGDGQFEFPYDLDIDAAGNVYITDFGNFQVQQWAPER